MRATALFLNPEIISIQSTTVSKENICELGVQVDDEETLRLRKLYTTKGLSAAHLCSDVKLLLRIIKAFDKRHGITVNREISTTLNRMLRWLGKRNAIRKEYFKLYFSILIYKIKRHILNGKFPKTRV